LVEKSPSFLAYLGLIGGLLWPPLDAASMTSDSGGGVERLEVRVHRSYPHDRDAYTQGLVWHEGKLYESTGQYGDSELRRVDPTSGVVETHRKLSSFHFGEGLARVDNRLVQLTWRTGIAFVYDLQSFDDVERFSYEGEGWGLCSDGRRLVVSDGSDQLTFRDPDSFQLLGSLGVTLESRPVYRLNELECVAGWIYANVYQTDTIVRIDPTSGEVTGIVDASGLLSKEESVGVDVLNGIAFDADEEVFFLTGKYWPKLFEVTFVPVAGN
jgi:glutaminyl-peptide cyclotransferase